MFGLQDQVNSASNLPYYAHSGLQVRQRNVSKQQRSNETTAQQMKDILSDCTHAKYRTPAAGI